MQAAVLICRQFPRHWRSRRWDRRQIAVPEALHFFTGREQVIELSLRLDVPVLHHDDVVGAAQSDFAVRDRQTGRRIDAVVALEDA